MILFLVSLFTAISCISVKEALEVTKSIIHYSPNEYNGKLPYNFIVNALHDIFDNVEQRQIILAGKTWGEDLDEAELKKVRKISLDSVIKAFYPPGIQRAFVGFDDFFGQNELQQDDVITKILVKEGSVLDDISNILETQNSQVFMPCPFPESQAIIAKVYAVNGQLVSKAVFEVWGFIKLEAEEFQAIRASPNNLQNILKKLNSSPVYFTDGLPTLPKLLQVTLDESKPIKDVRLHAQARVLNGINTYIHSSISNRFESPGLKFPIGHGQLSTFWERFGGKWTAAQQFAQKRLITRVLIETYQIYPAGTPAFQYVSLRDKKAATFKLSFRGCLFGQFADLADAWNFSEGKHENYIGAPLGLVLFPKTEATDSSPTLFPRLLTNDEILNTNATRESFLASNILELENGKDARFQTVQFKHFYKKIVRQNPQALKKTLSKLTFNHPAIVHFVVTNGAFTQYLPEEENSFDRPFVIVKDAIDQPLTTVVSDSKDFAQSILLLPPLPFHRLTMPHKKVFSDIKKCLKTPGALILPGQVVGTLWYFPDNLCQINVSSDDSKILIKNSQS